MSKYLITLDEDDKRELRLLEELKRDIRQNSFKHPNDPSKRHDELPEHIKSRIKQAGL